MTFTDKQMLEAIEANVEVNDCFKKITDACKALTIKTGCPNDDVDRFLEFAIGKWSDWYWMTLFICCQQYLQLSIG